MTFSFLVALVVVSVFSSDTNLLVIVNRRRINAGSYQKADATCVIDIFHKDGVVSDTTSYRQISQAADRLNSNCVNGAGQRTQGGYISDLGTLIL